MRDSASGRPQPALRGAFTKGEKGRLSSLFGTRWMRVLPSSAGLTLAAFSSACTPEPGPQIAPDCVARINQTALQAINRTGPLGQMQIFGSPTSFGPHLKRVEVRVFGGRTEIYAVDVTIDNACNILGASTRLETNYWNLR